MNRVADKVALVTGAARGIGAACATRLAAEGATVMVTNIDDAGGMTVAAAIGARALYRRLDVRKGHDWEAAIDALITRSGRLDILVNNAGITGFQEDWGPQDPENATLKSWRAVHETNLDGVFLGCRAAIRAMRPAGRGSIVNISSRSGVVGIAGAAAYASSKSAVRNHTKTVALYCADQGLNIRCNSIHPAAILTPMWEPMLGSGPERAAREQAVVRDIPMGRFGTAEEVADAVLFLASDESTYITGSELTIDGGILAGATARPTPNDPEQARVTPVAPQRKISSPRSSRRSK